MMTTQRMTTPPIADSTSLNERLRRVVAIHFDPTGGTPYWLERAERMGIDPRQVVRNVDDLSRFDDMTAADMRSRPLSDFVPQRPRDPLDSWIVGQTGGTTGTGVWTAYTEREFHEAFVAPFVAAAEHAGFPSGGSWLYVGPSGPHIIGKVVRHLAVSLGGDDPFSVDFDPRWAKVLPDGSFAQQRYIRHVVDQAVDVIDHQGVDVLFTTPPLLETLAETMSAEQRRRIRGVHYGGLALSSDALRAFQDEYFPNAVHLSGYGNTLFGCCLEFGGASDRPLDYYPYGTRLLFEVIDESGEALPVGQTGRVRFTRLDESMLIIRMRERDLAERIEPADGAPRGFVLPGVRDPHPAASSTPAESVGLY